MAILLKIRPDGSEELKEQGARVEAIQWNDDRTFKKVVDSKPVVGCSFLVGSVTARSYSSQDYWLTTVVTEIIEENLDEDGRIIFIRFRTTNSEYVMVGDMQKYRELMEKVTVNVNEDVKHPTKVLFLDHDGVICLATEWGSRFDNEDGLDSAFDRFNPGAIKVLNQIIEETDCDIVISSDWRLGERLETLQQLYKERGIKKVPIGVTDQLIIGKLARDLELNRQAEIKKWLSENPTVTHWVAVDDLDMSNRNIMDNYAEPGLDNFVITPRSREGIKQTGVKEKIIKFLK